MDNPEVFAEYLRRFVFFDKNKYDEATKPWVIKYNNSYYNYYFSRGLVDKVVITKIRVEPCNGVSELVGPTQPGDMNATLLSLFCGSLSPRYVQTYIEKNFKSVERMLRLNYMHQMTKKGSVVMRLMNGKESTVCRITREGSVHSMKVKIIPEEKSEFQLECPDEVNPLAFLTQLQDLDDPEFKTKNAKKVRDRLVETLVSYVDETVAKQKFIEIVDAKTALIALN